jgi:hypothetical protein
MEAHKMQCLFAVQNFIVAIHTNVIMRNSKIITITNYFPNIMLIFLK